eukprot:2271180-Pyramimonas_sp.AAC.1
MCGAVGEKLEGEWLVAKPTKKGPDLERRAVVAVGTRNPRSLFTLCSTRAELNRPALGFEYLASGSDPGC